MSEFLFPDPLKAPPMSPACMGANLEPTTLLQAYKSGFFPWFTPPCAPLWYSPDPRALFFEVKFHKSMRAFMKRYEVKFDHDFYALIALCEQTRAKSGLTWLSKELVSSFNKLHDMQIAHSVEVYESGVLIGGLYGLVIGRMFCGESMLSLRPNASKIALYALFNALKAYEFLIDGQVLNPHLEFMGATALDRAKFIPLMREKMSMDSGFVDFKELKFGF